MQVWELTRASRSGIAGAFSLASVMCTIADVTIF
jgi:hypothetical protein